MSWTLLLQRHHPFPLAAHHTILNVTGALLDDGLVDITKSMSGNSPEQWIQTLNLMGLAQKVLHDPDVASRFATTNARIYGAMQQIDAIKGNCGPPRDDYAPKYSSWMGRYLSTQGQQIQSVYKSIVATALPAAKLTTTLKDKAGKSTGEDTFLADKLAAVTKAFPAASMTYDAGKLLTFPNAPAESQAITIKKRDDSSTAVPTACAFSGASAATTTKVTTKGTTGGTTKVTTQTAKSIYTGTSLIQCKGNQIQGSCLAPTLSSQPAYGGTQGPACAKVTQPPASMGFQLVRMSVDKAESAVSTYCKALQDKKQILNKQSPEGIFRIFKNDADGGGNITVSVMFDDYFCPKDKSMSAVDFTKLSAAACKQNFFGYVKDGCSEDSSFQHFDSSLTLEGGMMGVECGLWSVYGQLSR